MSAEIHSFLFKIIILLSLGLCCPGRPHHSPRPSCAHVTNEEPQLPNKRNGTPQNFAKREGDIKEHITINAQILHTNNCFMSLQANSGESWSAGQVWQNGTRPHFAVLC